MANAPFSPDRANAALPLVRAIVADVVELAGRVAEATVLYRNLKADPRKPQTELNEARRALGELVEQRGACESELGELGVRLADAARGICDFPSEIDGQTVYLCWKLGEERVEFYHAPDAGFAGRMPLPVPVGAG